MNKNSHNKRRRYRPSPIRRPGFTLAELMVSVGVLVMLLMMVSMIFSTATRASSKATANNEICGKLRTLERQLRTDLQGIPKGAFLGIWYQLTPYPNPDDPTTNEWIRTDRLVFFTAGDHSTINQVQDTTGNTTNPDMSEAMPITSPMARIFYGHDMYSIPEANQYRPNAKEHKRLLARRVKLLTFGAVAPPTRKTHRSDWYFGENTIPDGNEGQIDDTYREIYDGNDDIYDNWEYERKSLGDWQNDNRYSIEEYFTLNDGNTSESYFEYGMMTDNGTFSWIRRPVINPSTQQGMHMYFLDGCAEFKVQRWIEYHPYTGYKLPLDNPVDNSQNPGGLLVGWWPEEDPDNNGTKNNPKTSGVDEGEDSQFLDIGSYENDLWEYFNGPKPSNTYNGIPNNTPCYPDNNGWLYYNEIPKAIKITVRLFDPMKRMEKGQTYTMVFRLRD